MNNMKKALLYSAMALATLTMSSCGDDFLVIDPAGSISEGTLINDQGIDFVLTGAYSTLYGVSGQWNAPNNTIANPIFGDVVGGDYNEGSQQGDQPDWNALEIYSITAANSYLSSKWNYIYEAVKRCNAVISMVNKGGDKIANADQIIGQALFLKGLWMFEGIKTFGAAIPYVTVEDYEASVDPQVSNVDENGNYVYIWDKVEADLQEAMQKLPATWDSDFGRATKWMAEALLGKLDLYWSSPYNGTNGSNAAKLAEAKTHLENVLNNGVDAKGQKYRLANTYQELFLPDTSDWTGESIIDIQLTLDGSNVNTTAVYGGYYTGFNGGTAPYPTGWGFFQPSYNYVNSMITDANGLPLKDFTSVPALSMDGDEITSDLNTTTDPRLDITIGRHGVPFLDWGSTPAKSWIRQTTTGGVYVSKKHQSRVGDRGTYSLTNYGTSNVANFHVLRVADVYLMLAEIAIRNNDLGTAMNYINTVRGRAANSYITAEAGITDGSYTFVDKVNGTTKTDAAANYCIGLYTSLDSTADAWEALKRERRAELCQEGHRWFDLARWGEVGSVLNNFVAYEKQFLAKYKNSYDENWICFPIPNSEIQTAEGRFVQNVNWK